MPKPQTPRAVLFPSPDPFDLPERKEFWGWPAQLLTELGLLLRDKDTDWVNGVSSLVAQVMASAPQEVDAPSVVRHEDMALTFGLDDPGEIGVFANAETSFPWSERAPSTEQWERYAVFALVQLKGCIDQLESMEDTGDTPDFLSTAFSAAGGFALNAMRGLQVAVSLQREEREKSARGKKAALARHDAMKPKRAEALSMANSQPFKTKESAIDYISQNLTIDPEGKRFISRRAAAEWLREARWRPKGK